MSLAQDLKNKLKELPNLITEVVDSKEWDSTKAWSDEDVKVLGQTCLSVFFSQIFWNTAFGLCLISRMMGAPKKDVQVELVNIVFTAHALRFPHLYPEDMVESLPKEGDMGSLYDKAIGELKSTLEEVFDLAVEGTKPFDEEALNALGAISLVMLFDKDFDSLCLKLGAEENPNSEAITFVCSLHALVSPEYYPKDGLQW